MIGVPPMGLLETLNLRLNFSTQEVFNSVKCRKYKSMGCL